jgi:hypothetical protein
MCVRCGLVCFGVCAVEKTELGKLKKACHLERVRVPVFRDEGESKDPEDVCLSLVIQGVLPKDYPGTGNL